MTAPTPTRADVLLAELDQRSFGERIRHVVAFALARADDPALPPLIDGLLAGDAYEASLAVWMAQALRRTGPLAAALSHRSRYVRGLAAEELARLAAGAAPAAGGAPAAWFGALVHAAAPALRRTLLKGLVRGDRADVGRALYPEVLARYGPREAAPLLPLLDEPTLLEQLPALAHAIGGWRALVARRPGALIGYLTGRLEAAPPRDRAGVWQAHGGLVGALAEARPAALFDLLERFGDECPSHLVWPRLGELARADAERATRLVERAPVRDAVAGAGLPKRLLNGAHRFTPAQHARLGRVLAGSAERLAPLLARVAPGRREALLTEAYGGDGGPLRLWPDALLDRMPRAWQRREAARMLALEAVKADPARVLALRAYLAPDEARAALTPALRASNAQDRGRAWALLVAAAGRAGRASEALGLLVPRLRNEQEPVRFPALEALARLSPSAFGPDDAEPLRALATDALEARDATYASRYALQRLAFVLLRANAGRPEGPLFAAGLDLLRLLAGRDGALTLPDLAQGLPRGTAPAVVAALRPRIVAANARERHGLVLALAQALGRRGHGLPELAALLEPLADAKPDAVAARAVALLLADPRGRDARVRALLDRDRSAIALPAVLAHLHLRRQAWLDPFLDGTPISGRFLTGRTVYAPPVRDGFHRWLPRQQRAFAALLRPAGHDRGHAQAARVQFIATLARLPVTTAADFAPFLQGGEVPVIEAALGALVWTDAPAEALPILLEHLDGDRARVAMYAVPRVARFVSSDVLAPLLAELAAAPGRKITVRKEALRLLGALRSPASVPALEGVVARPNLHKDVAIAVGHAARELIDDPRSLALLDRLARSPEPDVARSLLEPRPEQLPVPARPGYAALVLALAWHPDLLTRRAATRALGAWSVGLEGAIAARLAEVLVDLERGDTWAEACGTLAAFGGDGTAFDAIGYALEALAARADEPGPAPLERDLPARQRLLALAGALLALPVDRRVALRPRFDELADRLARGELWPLGARLRVAALDLAAPDAAARAVLGLAAASLAGDFLSEIVAAFEGQLAALASRLEPTALLALAGRLADGPAAAARLAVVATAAAGERADWPEAARSLLGALRRHGDPRVRYAAAQVFARPEP